MDSRYSNIFWHQGVKIFEDGLLGTKKGRARISHLENDVTKALLNIFQHCNKKLLGLFLRLLDIRQAPETFEFDFQVTDTYTYRQKNQRIMLSIISATTQTKSNPEYKVEKSQPDACIFNKDIAVLIESKTQSPLIQEQIESHIKHIIGTATKQRTLTWEEISERFNIYKGSVSSKDKFLISQFTEFLGLIGLAEFKGFLATDFAMLGAIEKIPYEEYLDFKRLLTKKIDRFMDLLGEKIKYAFQFKTFVPQVGKVNLTYPAIWSAFSFIDNAKTHVNYYPNINFGFSEHGIEFALNAETQTSVKKILSFIKQNNNEFERIAQHLKDFNFSLYFKYQYLPKDHFIWNFIPGYPKEMSTFTAKDVSSAIEKFGNDWHNYRKTLFFQMEKGMLKHPSGRFFSRNELDFALNHNRMPNFVIRFEKRYPSHEIEQLKKGVVNLFKGEILKLRRLIQSVVK